MTTFEEAWAKKEAAGYQYGEDALEQVRFGWEIAHAEQWVSVTERLPEPGQWVLCYRPGHHMRMFSHTGWGWRKEDGSLPSHALEYTHWRPLPPEPTP